MTRVKRSGLSRRTLLRGTLATGGAVALGLPLLDAMTNLAGTAHADGSRFPVRFALWFWGNGTEPGVWAPTKAGLGWAPTSLLTGLAPVRDQVSIVSGTSLPVRRRNNPHVEGAVGILAGGNPVIDPAYASEAKDWDYMTVSGASIDEVAADVVGNPRFRSLVLAVTPPHGVSGPGTAVRYTSHRGPYLYNAPTYDPSELYATLFGAGTPNRMEGPSPEDLARASVLDAVLNDARSLDARLGASDRNRLEHHLDALRDLETRLRSESSGSAGAACALPPVPGTTDSYRERARLMADLAAMAFACDLTRVVAMEFSSPASHSGYPDIFPGGLMHNGARISFHEYEHNAGYTENTRAGLRYFVDLFGEFVAALHTISEGGETLLDHAVVLGTSELAGGVSHTFDDYPLLVAGRAGGTLRQGVHLRMTGGHAPRVPLTILRALGWARSTWGTEQFETSEVISELMA